MWLFSDSFGKTTLKMWRISLESSDILIGKSEPAKGNCKIPLVKHNFTPADVTRIANETENGPTGTVIGLAHALAYDLQLREKHKAERKKES